MFKCLLCYNQSKRKSKSDNSLKEFLKLIYYKLLNQINLKFSVKVRMIFEKKISHIFLF